MPTSTYKCHSGRWKQRDPANPRWRGLAGPVQQGRSSGVCPIRARLFWF